LPDSFFAIFAELLLNYYFYSPLGWLLIILIDFVVCLPCFLSPLCVCQGVHTWQSDSFTYMRSVPLNDHVVELGPYTILTVDEGYAAVTQNNGKQMVLMGGHSHFLNHKNCELQWFSVTAVVFCAPFSFFSA